MACKNGTEDFPDAEAGRASLLRRGFVLVTVDKCDGRPVNEHYRHPDQQDDGRWQRADLFVPHNMDICRVSFWAARA